MTARRLHSADTLTVLVLGCGDVGSAVAHRLFRRGARVLLCDLPSPTHSRRGMAFTDALFDGHAELEGVAARRVDAYDDVERAWQQDDFVPVIALGEESLLRRHRFGALVDAILRRQSTPPDRRAMVDVAIGLGPGYTPGRNCHVAIETQWGADLGRVLRDRAPEPLNGGPRLLDGVGRERFVTAATDGTWRTTRAVGDAVRAGETIGVVDGTPVRSPLPGTLRGLARDGVAVACGSKLVEVDPRVEPQVFGLGERPVAIARGTCRALGLE